MLWHFVYVSNIYKINIIIRCHKIKLNTIFKFKKPYFCNEIVYKRNSHTKLKITKYF